MKHSFLLGLAVVSTLTFTSCKKKIESCKLGKSYISNGNSTPNANTFSYYSDGRLKKILYSGGSKDTLAYYADSISISSYASENTLSTVFTGVLNGSGQVITGTKATLDGQGNTLSSQQYTMTYNAEGNLIQQAITYAVSTDIFQYYYTGGNADSAVSYLAGARNLTYVFFHGDVENKTGIDDVRGVFTPYFGKPSKDLLDSAHIFTALDDTIRIKYTHTLDENEYVNKTVQTYLTPGVNTKFFTYQYFDCN
jgi:hypothetical protein